MLADIVGGSYKGRYIAMNPQRTINWTIQKDQLPDEDNKYKQGLTTTPGLTLVVDSTKSLARAQIVARTIEFERWFAVFDNFLYEITVSSSSYTATNRGQMTAIVADSNDIWMKVNANNQLMISSNVSSYYFDLTTNTLHQITDTNFPSNQTPAVLVDYLDYTEEYMIVTAGGRVYYNLNDVSTWDALNVFTPSQSASKTLATVIYRDNLFCFSQDAVSTYINDGTNPFSHQPQSTIAIGLVSAKTIKVFHDGIVFLGKSIKGRMRVYFYNGVECVPISVPTIEWQINNPSTAQDIPWSQLNTFTWSTWFDMWSKSQSTIYAELEYTIQGQILYYLTVVGLKTTFVYDFTVKEWTERQSFAATGGSIDREFRGVQLVEFQGSNYWTDLYSGKIYKEDFTKMTETENNYTITRTRISILFSDEKKNISISQFELDCSTGIGLSTSPSTAANVNFYYSRDGGNTYNGPLIMSTGVSGNYNIRPRIRGLGTARNWTFKLVLSDPADIMMQSGIIHGTVANY